MVVVEEYPDGDDNKEYANSKDNGRNAPTVGLLGGPHCSRIISSVVAAVHLSRERERESNFKQNS